MTKIRGGVGGTVLEYEMFLKESKRVFSIRDEIVKGIINGTAHIKPGSLGVCVLYYWATLYCATASLSIVIC